MRSGLVTALSLIMIMTLCLFGCGDERSPGEADSPAASEPVIPEVSAAEAEQAMSDAMLISALSLFLAFSADEGDTEVTNEDGTLKLEWDDTADFTTGVGLYRMTMQNYSIPVDDPFSQEYNGYILNGTVTMGSTDGVSTTMEMNLTTTHPDAENFPVQSIDLSLEGIQEATEQVPDGYIRINGHEMSFEDLSQALELGD